MEAIFVLQNATADKTGPCGEICLLQARGGEKHEAKHKIPRPADSGASFSRRVRFSPRLFSWYSPALSRATRRWSRELSLFRAGGQNAQLLAVFPIPALAGRFICVLLRNRRHGDFSGFSPEASGSGSQVAKKTDRALKSQICPVSRDRRFYRTFVGQAPGTAIRDRVRMYTTLSGWTSLRASSPGGALLAHIMIRFHAGGTFFAANCVRSAGISSPVRFRSSSSQSRKGMRLLQTLHRNCAHGHSADGRT
jgi:hypothetical protein